MFENDQNKNQPKKLKITIKKWHMVAGWKWKVSEECCSICRTAFDSFCPSCKFPGDDCPPVWGQCTHVFHMHCIVHWLHNKNEEEQQCMKIVIT